MEPKGIGIVMKQERDQSYETNLLRDTFSPQGLQMVILKIVKNGRKRFTNSCLRLQAYSGALQQCQRCRGRECGPHCSKLGVSVSESSSNFHKTMLASEYATRRQHGKERIAERAL